MKSQVILLLTVGLMLSGCSTHFYKVQEDEVTIYLRQPDVETPVFFCSLDDYSARKMKKKLGFWMVTLPANNPFRYFYVLDGNPFIPSCKMREYDDFGSENCIFEPEL